MVTPCCFTESAKKRTVAGGTSPTAVTLCPSTTVENAEDVPTVADSFFVHRWRAIGRMGLDKHRDRSHPVGEYEVIDRIVRAGQDLSRVDGHLEARRQLQRAPEQQGGRDRLLGRGRRLGPQPLEALGGHTRLERRSRECVPPVSGWRIRSARSRARARRTVASSTAWPWTHRSISGSRSDTRPSGPPESLAWADGSDACVPPRECRTSSRSGH